MRPAVAWAIWAVLAGALIGGVSPARAQQGLDGRTFSGLDLPALPERGEIELRAARAWIWKEGNTDRMLLDRDVHVVVGPYEFNAPRAVVWLEPVTVNGQEADQIAVYLDRGTAGGGGRTGVSQRADRLLVTGIIINDGAALRPDVLRHGRPEDLFIDEAEQRLARYLATLPGAEAIARRLGSPADPLAWIPPDDRPPLAPAARTTLEYPDDGLVSFSPGGDVVIHQLEEEGLWAVQLTGGVDIQYDRVSSLGLVGGGGRARTVQLSAQRAVAFLDIDAQPGLGQYQLREVRGVYLEGDVVASSDDYTLRGAQIYYDLRSERAVILDAVFWTYVEAKGLPLYLRADELRQEAENQWSGEHVTLANVGFAEPHFSIGAREVTITRMPADPNTGEPERRYVDAQSITLRMGNTGVFWWPRLRGEFRPFPLRELSAGAIRGDPVIRTTWDLYTLLGLDPADGNSAFLMLDGYFGRGPAAGAELEWNTPDITGSLLGYYIYDDGTDRLPTGAEIERDNDHRGLILADQIWRLNENWTLFIEGSYVSDETFVPAFFRELAESRREFTNSLYARYMDERSALTIEARGTFNDFVVNQYLLQSQGYQVQSVPDIAYRRLNDALFGGLLSYSSEFRFSRMRFAFNEPTMAEMGFQTPEQSLPVFGLLPGQSIGDALRGDGLNEDWVNRFDTRHEIEMPLQAGALSIVPFAAGRVTYYNTEFAEFTSAQGFTDVNDRLRGWYSAGLHLGTTIHRINRSLDSEFFDLHGIRHIIEPSAMVWTADTNVNQERLPVYDEEVESLADGTAVRLAMRNTWQTKRGRVGDRQSVNWLVIDTEYIWSNDQVQIESPLGRFVAARPERSNLGKFLNNDITMQFTDAVSFSNNLLYDQDQSTLARATLGGAIDHGFGFTSFMEYRYLRQPEGTFLDAGLSYELTRKYALSAIGTYNAEMGTLQNISALLTRRMTQLTLEIGFNYDNIAGDVSVGVSLRPVGTGTEDRTRVLTRDLFARQLSQPQPLDAERISSGPFGDN